MKRKAIERIKPKKPEGKGLTATLQELGEILILNIYQAKELLVRYCINYETGEHEYWKEQYGWRKGGILNALNKDWRHPGTGKIYESTENHELHRKAEKGTICRNDGRSRS